MSELSELYQEVILDHNRNPRNFCELKNADRKGEGYNPLCGDRLTVYLKMDGDKIQEIGFQGEGCAISKASASLMTTSVAGKTRKEAERLFAKFHLMVTSDPANVMTDPELGKLTVFSGVCEFPSRVKCASLAWHTLNAAFEGKRETVSTEEEKKMEEVVAAEQKLKKPLRRATDLKEKVIEALKLCYDPEIPVNIYEMGLIYDVDVTPDGDVLIQMTLTSPACPVAGSLPPEVEYRIRAVPGVKSASVEVVWDPPWTLDRMSNAAKLQLGIG